eukprot:366449-Chlamydomonas_euryale.AAC.23
MAAVEEHCVMNLTEADVYNVWGAVAQQQAGVAGGVWGTAVGCGRWSVGHSSRVWQMECGAQQSGVAGGVWGTAVGCGT